MDDYLYLIGGIALIVIGVFLMARFVVQFAELIAGIVLLVIGLNLVGQARRPRARARRR